MKLAVFWALAWRLAVFLSVPVLTLRRSFAASPLSELVGAYPIELIFFGSILCLFLGSLLGTVFTYRAYGTAAQTVEVRGGFPSDAWEDMQQIGVLTIDGTQSMHVQHAWPVIATEGKDEARVMFNIYFSQAQRDNGGMPIDYQQCMIPLTEFESEGALHVLAYTWAKANIALFR